MTIGDVKNFVNVFGHLPDDWLVSGFTEKEVRILTSDLNDARSKMSEFPGAFWTKEYSESLHWWEFVTQYRGMAIRLFGCHEAPPTCVAVEEEYEEEERVPVEYETRTVTKKRVRWVCGNDEEQPESAEVEQ